MINEGLKKYLQNSKVINLAVLDSVVDREIEKATEGMETGGFDEDTARFVAGQLQGEHQTKLKLNSQNLRDFDFSIDYDTPLDSRSSSLVYYIDFSEITIPKEVEKIGKYCFWMSASDGFEIINFESIENLKEIGDYAFKSYTKPVVNIKNKNGVIEKIGKSAFYMPTTGDTGLSKEEVYNRYLKDLVENSEFIQADSFGSPNNYMTIYYDGSQGIDYEVLGDTFFFRSGCYADENGNGPWNNYKKIGKAQESNWAPSPGTDPKTGKKIITLDGELEIIGGKISYGGADIINIGDKVRKIGAYLIEGPGGTVINIGSGIEKIEKGSFIVESWGDDFIVNIKAKSSDFPNYKDWFSERSVGSTSIIVNFLED